MENLDAIMTAFDEMEAEGVIHRAKIKAMLTEFVKLTDCPVGQKEAAK